MERVLVTGADGFVASHLVPELVREVGCEVRGIGLKQEPVVPVAELTYRVADLTDRAKVEQLLEDYSPDAVFHLAAQSSVALSWEDPWGTYQANILGQLNLMEAVRKIGLKASVHIACSSEEYGKVQISQMPMTEERPFRPCSHYAVSKVGQEVLGLMYHQAFGWRVFVTRGFNQAGPGQSPDFVVSSFARQVAMIEKGLVLPVIKVGNLDAKRDFTDVRDTVKAYRMLMESGAPGGAYNICSGKAVAISEVLEKLLGLSEIDIRIEADPSRQRPSDIPLLLGDNSRVRADTGWAPVISLEQTLRDTLDYWRENV